MDTKRFNNPEYKSRIRAVRTYRRQVPAKPETAADRFFYAIGLQTWFSRICAVLALALLVYLAYFAKFLQISAVAITGVDDSARQVVLDDLAQYEQGFKYLMPQKNLIFFSENSFSKYLLAQDQQIAKVDSIHKKLWRGLVINLDQRLPAFTLQVGENSYILNSDGTIGAELAPEPVQAVSADNSQLAAATGAPTAAVVPAATAPSSPYPLITDTGTGDNVSTGDKFFTDQQIAFLQYIQQNFSRTIPVTITGYSMDGNASDDLTVQTSAGFTVLFTDTTDPRQYLQRMLEIWQQLTPAQQGNLSYLDMRFEKDAYGCYKTDPCAQ